jgi:hypothetical protein
MAGIKFDYVTASQGRIFIGGVLVDECFDIQYSYQESKEPIYGYNSKHFDKLIKGQVIIYGNFTINYKHDSYLKKVFQTIKANESFYAALERRTEDTEVKNEYANTLKKYKQLQKDLTDKKAKLKQLKDLDAQYSAHLKDEEIKDNAILSDNHAKVRDSLDKRSNFETGLTQGEAQYVTTKKSNFNSTAKDAADWKKELESELAKSNKEIAAAQQELDSTQTELNKVQVLIDKGRIVSEDLQAYKDQIANYQDKIQELEDKIKSCIKTKEEITNDCNEIIAGKNDQMQSMLNDGEHDPDGLLKRSISLDLAVDRTEADFNAFVNKPEGDELALLKSQDKDNKQKITDLNNEMIDAENILKSSRDELQRAKDKEKKRAIDLTSAINNPPTDQNGNLKIDTQDWRPEDFGNFSILIEYDGQIHKVLEDCQLSGHSHVITNSGQNVKEYYNFIARKLIG